MTLSLTSDGTAVPKDDPGDSPRRSSVHSMWGQRDRFGVPANTFGAVPDEFYGAVGRVVMLSALVENTFAFVVTTLDRKQEADYAGQPIGQLQKTLDRIAKDRVLSQRFVDARAEMIEVLEERNAIVHSLWPSPTMDAARGWRPVVERKRNPSGEHIAWVEHTDATLTALIGRLLNVYSALRDLFGSGEID